jgi:hypothetical protein
VIKFLINFIRYYKIFIRYGLGYEGEAWFANNYIWPYKKKGFYVDIGCYHPVKFSQTFKLYKFGWTGINIDISRESIDLFNLYRPKDKNLNLGISLKSGLEDGYFNKNISTTNFIDSDYSNYINKKKYIIRKIKTKTINQIFEEHNISEVDFLKIDCEGMDLSIIKSFNFDKYKVSFLSIEFLYGDVGNFIKKKNSNIQSVHQLFFKSEIYQVLKNNFELIDHFGFAFLLANKKIYE